MVTSVSLVITVYNRERYLDIAIESILAQTYPHFELLIWDDGSTDDSIAIAQHYAAQDQRIRVVSASHQGRALALRAAVAETSGVYVGWVDSDDLLTATALEETTRVLDTHPDIGLVYTDYLVIDEYNNIQGLGHRCHIPYSKERLLLEFMTFHFRLMRHDVYLQVGGIDESFPCAQDYDLCLKLSEVTEVIHLKRSLYYYRNHKQNLTNQQRLNQIFCSKRAIENALQRRGMTDEYELEVQIVGHFFLQQKKKPIVAQSPTANIGELLSNVPDVWNPSS